MSGMRQEPVNTLQDALHADVTSYQVLSIPDLSDAEAMNICIKERQRDAANSYVC